MKSTRADDRQAREMFPTAMARAQLRTPPATIRSIFLSVVAAFDCCCPEVVQIRLTLPRVFEICCTFAVHHVHLFCWARNAQRHEGLIDHMGKRLRERN